jgi:hypothetical protein
MSSDLDPKQLVEAAQAGFATGLVSDLLAGIVGWHGNPHHPETQAGVAWDIGYGAGRAAGRSSPLGKIERPQDPVVRTERAGLP